MTAKLKRTLQLKAHSQVKKLMTELTVPTYSVPFTLGRPRRLCLGEIKLPIKYGNFCFSGRYFTEGG